MEILMESRIKQTIELHNKGYNCAQAIACTYCDLVGIDEKTALCATEGFGAGMGGMQATCGAVSGAVFLAGMKGSDGAVGAPKSKARTFFILHSLLTAVIRIDFNIIKGKIAAPGGSFFFTIF